MQSQAATLHFMLENTRLALDALSKQISSASFDAFASRLCTASVIYFTGVGKAGLVAQKCAATGKSYGMKTHFIHPTEALHGDLGALDSNDHVLLISNSGRSTELTALASVLQLKSCPTYALVGNYDSPLAKMVDHLLSIGQYQETCHLGVAPTLSCLLLQLVGDALIVSIAKAREVTLKDFKSAHPAGALGQV